MLNLTNTLHAPSGSWNIKGISSYITTYDNKEEMTQLVGMPQAMAM
jgi:hypothetical protein